jgi:hypothetical protein
MLKQYNNRALGILVIAVGLLAPYLALGQHGWPVEPGNVDHPMGNTMGEYIFGLQHAGIDLMELPMYDASNTVDPAAPWVIVTVAGDVDSLDDVANTRYNFTSIDPTLATNTAIYWYGHLQNGSYHVNYINAFNNGTPVAAGDRIAKIVRWNLCDFHHLHYELIDGSNYINPLADITPKPDTDSPEIEDILFAQDNSNPWLPFSPVAGSACTVVSGPADILVQARDFDEAGASLGGPGELWIYNMRWRACPDSSPSCAWQTTRPFDSMPTSWYAVNNAATLAQFSNRAPWISNSSYCNAGWDYAIVTNYVSGMPNVAGNWNTTTIADGSYSVSVELTDLAGNVTVRNRRACVENSVGCTTELTIRDWTDDYGAIPYSGPHWWLSPDITANPGTADQDVNINLDTANQIDVRVWNFGTCSLPPLSSYQVCLGWGLPSSTVAHPLPPGQQIGCLTEIVPASGWAVGTSRTTTFTWTPSSASVPNGHHCLVAWVDMPPADPVQSTPAVNWDDNRAQQNITFKAASPGRPSTSSFWVNPHEMIRDRSLELTLSYGGNRATLRELRLHVAPGLMIKNVVGGSIVGAYHGDKPIDPCEMDPELLKELLCLSWEEASKHDITRVIGGIDPDGRLILEGIEPFGEPVRITVEVVPDEDIPKGAFADINVVEHGRLAGHKAISPVGGLTVRFTH